MKELGIEQGGVQLHCDSQSAIDLTKNQVYHAKTKHIDLRFHKIRESVTSSQILLKKVYISNNAADMLTKAITTDKFKHCLNLLNVLNARYNGTPNPRHYEVDLLFIFHGAEYSLGWKLLCMAHILWTRQSWSGV